MHKLKAILISMRPRQWIKNLFVFAGIAFSRNLFHVDLAVLAGASFLIFCALSSGVYLFNDIIDRDEDRKHPVKALRPLAAGSVSVRLASGISALLVVGGLSASWFLGPVFFSLACAYILIHLAYSWGLKHIVILDILIIASGFVIRVAAGSAAVHVQLSTWLFVCTLLISVFLGLAKRRHELILLAGEAAGHRPVLVEYTPDLLDQMIPVVTSSTLVTYALYTMSRETVERFGTPHLIFTIPFVLYGIFRYLYLIHQRGEGGNPENLIVSDLPLMLSIVLWAITAGFIIYLH